MGSGPAGSLSAAQAHSGAARAPLGRRPGALHVPEDFRRQDTQTPAISGEPQTQGASTALSAPRIALLQQQSGNTVVRGALNGTVPLISELQLAVAVALAGVETSAPASPLAGGGAGVAPPAPVRGRR